MAAGRAAWQPGTVLMVDEAAMLATKELVAVMTAARDAGAKLILVGDDQQLGSAFLRGGLFGVLADRFPALVSVLSEIRRIHDRAPDADGQRRAFNAMHAGRFCEALGIFDAMGAIHWSDTHGQALAALAARYARDLTARPQGRRFVFAHSNADARTLNEALRAVHCAQGALGDNRLLLTKDGPAIFAVGDRIQFTGNAYRLREREAGLANGMVGTVRAIDGMRMTVELDGKPGARGRLLSFTVGDDFRAGEFNRFRHGYAGTVYKGQGATVDIAYRLHGGQERAATNYVGNTRHTDSLLLFTSREAVRGSEPWMGAKGGLPHLTDAQRASAECSYAAWVKAEPRRGQRSDLADYVAYVQNRWTPEKARAADLDQLARRMGRHEEHRAASQFHRVDRTTLPSRALTPRMPTGPAQHLGSLRPPHQTIAEAGMRDAAAPFIQAIRRTGAVTDIQRGGHPWWGREAERAAKLPPSPRQMQEPSPTADRKWQDFLVARLSEKSRDGGRGFDH